MTHRRGRRAVSALLVGAALAASGCGGDDADDSAAAARTYATAVARTTDATRAMLAETSRDADYRDAAAAAATTQAYAAAIRRTAVALADAAPPSAVAASHRELVDVYRQTATRLDGLAGQFRSAPDDRALTTLAQQLSGEVQTLSTREAELRAEIDAGLARIAPTTPGG